MKPFYFLILTVLLALALSGCVRSIAPGNDAQATGSAETALPSGDTSSSVTLVTPGLETVMPPVGSPADGTTEAPLAENILCAYPPEWVPYIVQEGDTLESLALLSGIEGGEIVTNNCLYATGAPPTGTTIYLPATEAVLQSQAAASEPAATAEGEAAATTEAGAAATTEGEAAAVSESEAAATTNDQAASEGSCKSPYTVKGGDWVYKIGRHCNIDPAAIIAANHLAYPYWLRPGQVLVLPKNAPPFPK